MLRRGSAQHAGPIERQLSTISGITSLTSTSALGIATMVIQFDLNRQMGMQRAQGERGEPGPPGPAEPAAASNLGLSK